MMIFNLLKDKNFHYGMLIGSVLGILILITFTKLNMIAIGQKTYAYVNVEKVIASVKQGLNDKDKDKDENEEVKLEKIKKAKLIFGSELESYSKKNNAVVFSSVKVISGAKDITDEIISVILKELI